MDNMPEMKLNRDHLASLAVPLREESKTARQDLKAGHERFAELEQQTRKHVPNKWLGNGFFLKAEEQRQHKQPTKRRIPIVCTDSDDAAVYRNFPQSQICWPQPIREFIKPTPQNSVLKPYRRFLNGLPDVFRTPRCIQRDKQFSDAGQSTEFDELNNSVCDLGSERIIDETKPSADLEARRYFLSSGFKT